MKKAFYIGAVAGGLLGIIISLSMDLLLGNTLGGGWSEAVAHDMNNIFRTNLPQNHVVVILGVVVVIGIIASIGSFIGGVFSVMITRIFLMLTKDRQ
jgi:cell division protein FtsX